MHLMSFISPLDGDLALVYPRIAPVRLMELLAERGIEVVEVPDDEFESMGANVLALGPRRALALEGNDETRRRLERAGVEVLDVSRRPHLAARRRRPDVFDAASAAGATMRSSLVTVEGQLPVLREARDADAHQSERSRPVSEAAVEQPARELRDPLCLVDRRGQRRRSAADREVRVAELGRHRPRRELPLQEARRNVRRHALDLRVEEPPVGDVPLERLLDRQGDAFGLELQIARIDAARAIAKQGADRAGEDGAKLGIGETGEVTDRLHSRRSEAGLRLRADARQRADGNGARKTASFPGGTTVIPPGLRRSEATLQTTFEVETPSEHDSDVAARTDVCTASAAARASVNVRTTVPRSR